MGPDGTCFWFFKKFIRGAISILIPTSKISKWTWKKNEKLDLLFQGENFISGVNRHIQRKKGLKFEVKHQ
jgi:hypothetical protein